MLKKTYIKNCLIIVLGSAILAFGIYNIHSISNVTEGGIIGLTLLLQHCFGISPAISDFVLNALCFVWGWRVFGKKFLLYSGIAAVAFSGIYALLECFPRVYPQIADMPLAAALAGAVFIGVGAGICVKAGGATAGDDALAMCVSKLTGIKIAWVYLASDVLVLGLSLIYIPLGRIIYSLITVIISGQIIGFIVRTGKNSEKS